MRYVREFEANTNTPPIGLGTDINMKQSCGSPETDQMTGCNRWRMFSDSAAREYVSGRTAIRLKFKLFYFLHYI